MRAAAHVDGTSLGHGATGRKRRRGSRTTGAVAIACAGASAAACASAAPRGPEPVVHRAAPTPPTDAPPVMPLLADQLAPTFERRARIERYDRVWLDDLAPAAGRPGTTAPDTTAYAVVDDDGDRVRLRVDDAWVRVLVWVERDDLRPALVRDTAADGLVRPLARGASVHIRAGAPIALARGGGGGTPITVEDEQVTVFGTVPGDAVGTDWRVDAALAPAAGAPDLLARPRPPGSVAKQGEVFDSPFPGAQVIARVDRIVAATAEHPSPAAGWHHVTLDTPYLSVTGYVPASSWIAGGRLIMTETAILPGDATGVRLAAGTCLYARPDGALVGVVLVDQPDARRGRHGWARWEWATWWGRIMLYARPVGDGFESCEVAAASGPGV